MTVATLPSRPRSSLADNFPLFMHGVVKRYGSKLVLAGVDLKLRRVSDTLTRASRSRCTHKPRPTPTRWPLKLSERTFPTRRGMLAGSQARQADGAAAVDTLTARFASGGDGAIAATR